MTKKEIKYLRKENKVFEDMLIRYVRKIKRLEKIIDNLNELIDYQQAKVNDTTQPV